MQNSNVPATQNAYAQSESQEINTTYFSYRNLTAAESTVASASSEDESIRSIQTWRNLLSHATECQKNGTCTSGENNQCTVSHCSTTKYVLNHIDSCQAGKSCIEPYCFSSKLAILYWRNNSPGDRVVCGQSKQSDSCFENREPIFQINQSNNGHELEGMQKDPVYGDSILHCSQQTATKTIRPDQISLPSLNHFFGHKNLQPYQQEMYQSDMQISPMTDTPTYYTIQCQKYHTSNLMFNSVNVDLLSNSKVQTNQILSGSYTYNQMEYHLSHNYNHISMVDLEQQNTEHSGIQMIPKKMQSNTAPFFPTSTLNLNQNRTFNIDQQNREQSNLNITPMLERDLHTSDSQNFQDEFLDVESRPQLFNSNISQSVNHNQMNHFPVTVQDKTKPAQVFSPDTVITTSGVQLPKSSNWDKQQTLSASNITDYTSYENGCLDLSFRSQPCNSLITKSNQFKNKTNHFPITIPKLTIPTKTWHRTTEPELRQLSIRKIIHVLFPTIDENQLQDPRLMSLVLYGAVIEKEAYEASNSKEEYHDLLKKLLKYRRA